MIATGNVAVNGRLVKSLGSKVDPSKVKISVEGKAIDLSPPKIYVMLNKPPGYTSTRRDPHAKRTVLQLVKQLDVYLYPAGRLDVDSEGLLILTNDGEFAHRLTHPAYNITKTYHATVLKAISEETLERLRHGVELEDGTTAPAEAGSLEIRAPIPDDIRAIKRMRLAVPEQISVVELKIHEGRKRQVRRMFAALGQPVIRLVRKAIAGLELGDLPVGKWRRLTKREVAALMVEAER